MTEPKISFIVMTADKYADCRRVVTAMTKQTAVDEIELIIVGPSLKQMQVVESDLTPFHSVQVIELWPMRSTGTAMAAAVEVANAPFVGYVEEHGYPDPVLAETVIKLTQNGDYAAVGWAMTNANPGWVSWAHLYGQFGPVVEPVISREVSSFTGHHAAYNRELLLDYGDHLPMLLSNEIMLQMDLHRRGFKLFLTGEVVVGHLNISKLGGYFQIEYIGQRGFGATRTRVLNWSWTRRLLYAGGMPLVPFIRLRRSLRDVRRTGRAASLLPQIAFIMFAANCCGAVGEAMGYLFGSPESLGEKRLPIELNRSAYIVDRDRDKEAS